MISYLALGDSYTIGEGVALFQSFPYQLVQLLRAGYYDCHSPEILAKTGWTTDELQENMQSYLFNSHYDLVTLLIGVNNQYRGGSEKVFSKQFHELLLDAIGFANNVRKNVHVLSIPNWGLSPFAEDRDRDKITAEIGRFNSIIEETSSNEQVSFIDITSSFIDRPNDASLFAQDGLHPSSMEYARWASLLFERISSTL